MISSSVSSAASLSVTAIDDAARLESLAAGWSALAGDVPFRSFHWAQCWWQYYRRANCKLFTLAVTGEKGELVGLAPWYVESTAPGGRVVRFLGSGEVCSDYLTILCRREMQTAVAHRLADFMAREGAGAWHLLELTGVEQSDAAVEQFATRLAEHGHITDTRCDLSCWRVTLPDDWQRFLSTLSRSRRTRIRAILRESIESGRAVIHAVTTREELDGAFPILVDLHQKRRRSLRQVGCFASSRFTEFHRDVSARLLAAGQLRLSWIECDKQPVSVDYSFLGGDTVYYYQGGFDPEQSERRPGWISHASALKLAIEQGYRGYDFLRGDESYKSSWGAAPRQLLRVRVVGRQAAARARYATWRGSQAVKRWTRHVLSRAKG